MLRVLSLFDWCSWGQQALERLWIIEYQYFASEIDKFAISVTQKNFPNTIQVGSVTDIKGEDYWQIDLLCAGTPCQGFSFAWKQLNFEDERSKLFFEYVRILKEVKPRYFMLENVKMKKEFSDIITEHLFWVTFTEINSALLSWQNRKRLYWVWERQEDWTYKKVEISQPEDKRIFLKDILEENVDEKYNISNKHTEAILINREVKDKTSDIHQLNNPTHSNNRIYWIDWKSPTLNTMQWGNRQPKILIERDWLWNQNKKLITKSLDLQSIRNILRYYLLTIYYVSTNETNTNSILSFLWYDFNKKEVSELKIWSIISLYEKEILQSDMYVKSFWWEENYIHKNQYNTLSCQKNYEKWDDLWDMWSRECKRCSSSWWRPHEQSEREFTETLQMMPQFTTQNIKSMQDMWKKSEMTMILRKTLPKIQKILRPSYDCSGKTPSIRKLTVTETERLQTMKDWYTAIWLQNWVEVPISNSQRYKMIWNWWTTDVIAYIFSHLKLWN